MKKILLSLLAIFIVFSISAQVNLIQNGDMEEEGYWIIYQQNPSDPIWYEFGSKENTVEGGVDGNLVIKHTATAAEAADITIYQALDLVAEEEYLWHCAFRDLSPNLENCWWASYSWALLEPGEGDDPNWDENEIVWMNEWQHKAEGEGYNGLWDTAYALIDTSFKRNIFIPQEDGIHYVGINVGTCITGGGAFIADIHFIFDEIAMIDQDAVPEAVNPRFDENGNSLNAYPNPASSNINFKYSVSENSDVELSLINILGQEVAIVVKDSRSKGKYRESFDCSKLTNGMYYGVLKVNNSIVKKKIMVLK
jgi:hypothetical protein